MSTLKALLKDVPVEWKAIGELCEVVTDYVAAGSFAALRENVKYYDTKGFAQLIRTKDLKSGFTNKDFVYVKEDAFKFLWRVNLDVESIILPNIGNCGEVYLVTPNMFPTTNNVLGPNAILVRSLKCNQTFLSYIFKSDHFQKQLKQITTPGGQTKFNKTELKKLQIPIPHPNDPEKSLAIQQEIVRVLDGLSEQNKALTSALAQEIAQRKKQYEYYREELFRFEGKEVEWKTFGELGEIIRGNGLQKSDFTESGVGCIHYGQIYTYYGTSTERTKSFVSQELAEKLKKVNKGDLIITNTSENVEDVCKAVAWLGEDEIVTGGHACILKHYENAKYIAYYTQCSEFFKDKKKFAKGTKVMDVSAKDLAKIKIPVPCIQEQDRIVRLLDQFDEATKSIVAQLEKEIELRNKQYEYYRNLLLSFPKGN